MKYFVFAMLVVSLVAVLAMGASADNILWDFDGTKALTPQHQTSGSPFNLGAGQGDLGWSISDRSGNPQDGSWGEGLSGTNGIVKVFDDGSHLMKVYGGLTESSTGYPADGTVLKHGGIMMAKIYNWATGNSGNTSGFGYSTADGNNSVVVCLRNGGIQVKASDGSGSDSTEGYATQGRWGVYALQWKENGIVNVWESVGSDWSGNMADWTLVKSNKQVGGTQTALLDSTGNRLGGILLGNFNDSGSYSQTANLDVDWIALQSNMSGLNDFNVNPWEYNPFEVAQTPEPGSLLALGSGLIGMVGFAIRRRRA